MGCTSSNCRAMPSGQGDLNVSETILYLFAAVSLGLRRKISPCTDEEFLRHAKEWTQTLVNALELIIS